MPHPKPNFLRSQLGLASLLAAIAVGADFETAGALIGCSQADIEKEMDESPNFELRVNQAKARFAVNLLISRSRRPFTGQNHQTGRC